MIDGGCFLDVMPAKAVPVEDEEDLPPLAEQAGGLVPDDAREEGGGQGGVTGAAPGHPPGAGAHSVLATTRHHRGPRHTEH